MDIRGSSCYAFASARGGPAYTTLIEAMALESIALNPIEKRAAATLRI